jgi:hypothetical protein
MNQVIQDLLLVQAEIEAVEGLPCCEDLILAWGNGLAVKFYEPGKPSAVHALHAECIVSKEQAAKMPEEAWAYIPIVRNGHGEKAALMSRGAVLAKEKAKVAELIAQFG